MTHTPRDAPSVVPRAVPSASQPPPWPPERSSPAPPRPRPAWSPPGTPAKDVTVGGDNDNADNPFIQPPGVTAKQHMDNTDVLFGRANDDLLIGKLGGDTLLGGEHNDILIGGPEKAATPNSDVLIGEEGNDINIWAPGDGSDVFAGNEGKDTMIFAPFVEKANGSLLLTNFEGRKIPHVDIDGQAAFTCTIVEVPRVGEARLPVPGALQRQRRTRS